MDKSYFKVNFINFENKWFTMKIAILSVTDEGKKLSLKLHNLLIHDSKVTELKLFHKDIKNTLKAIFNDYDLIIGIMATGIMVRLLCPLLKHKSKDPGVLIIDEAGNFVISLVSGHLGRANEMTDKISKLINAVPVITTATDVQYKIGIDTLANKYYWKIINPELIVYFNKNILLDKKIMLISSLDISYPISSNDKKYETYISSVKNYNDLNFDLKNLVQNHLKKLNYKYKNDNFLFFITNDDNFKIDSKVLIAIPQKFVVGIGARKDISKEKVLFAIEESLKQLEIPIERVDSLATGYVKEKETGIIEASKELELPLEIASFEELENFSFDDYSKSDFVEKTVGFKGICEPSAIIKAGKNSKLIYKKTAYNGVTIAVAVSNDY